MPGHGTLPSGLLHVGWKDWYAAVVLAAKYAAARGGPGRPFMAAGHSTGAALIALYSVRALDDASLPRFTDIHLLSSAIGISRFAALTNVISGLSFLPAFEKSRWIDVLPEYDPYKYNSFPVNAANQIYRLTHVLQDALDRHSSGTLASMGCSVPYGIAAKLYRPDLPLIALTGDGAMQMAGLAELVTVSRMWPQWSDPRFVVCVFHNGDLAEVSWEQRETGGDPVFPDSQDLPAFPYAGYAELLGMKGLRVDDPDELGGAWDLALAADRPVVLEVITDRSVPLLPPFPAGAEKLDTMRSGLAQEGQAGAHARRLLDIYAAQESAPEPVN
jgi:hypothetical protein